MNNQVNKPTCKVHGMVAPNGMCGHVIVGLKYCGFKGDCPHKSSAEMIVNLVRDVSQDSQSNGQDGEGKEK